MVAELTPPRADESSLTYINPHTLDFIANLIACHGNIALAQDKSKITQNDVVEILNDPAAQTQINGAIRTKVILATYEALDDMSAVLPAMLSGIDPNDAFKAFSSLVQGLAALTAPPKQSATLQLNSNTFNFDKSDAEAARGKLIDFITAASTRPSREVESTSTRPED